MVKLVDTPDLGSGAARCEGSSPFTRTKKPKVYTLGFFCYCSGAISISKPSKSSVIGIWQPSLELSFT